MAYVNGTTHYNLPQTVGTDKRDWADTNEAFAAVDAALYGAVDDVAAAATEITSLKGRMTTAETNIGQNTSDIAGLDTRLTTAEGAITSQQSQITDTRQDLEDMICAYNEATATSTHAYEIGDYFIYNDVLYRAIQAIAIGDTIVPDTNCTTTNVTTEISAIEDLSGDVQQLQTDVGQLQTDIVNKEDKPTISISTSTASTYNNLFIDAMSSLLSGSPTNDQIRQSTVRIATLDLVIDEVTDQRIKSHVSFVTSDGSNLRTYAFIYNRNDGTSNSYAGSMSLTVGISETPPANPEIEIII